MTGRTARWPVSAAAVVLAPTLLAGCQPDPQVGASSPGPVASPVGASATATPRPTASSTPSTGGKTLTGTVRWVLDGDTFDLRDKAKQNHRVRLLGIDAPELATDDAKAQCGAATAKKALAKLLPAGTSVTVSFDPRADNHDRFGRDLGYVRTSKTGDVALSLLQRGIVASWSPASSRPPSRKATYDAAEAKARNAKKGLWAACDSIGR